LDVVLRPITSDNRSAVFDRLPGRLKGDELEQQGRAAAILLKQTRLSGRRQYGLDSFPGPDESDVVLVGQGLIQRAFHHVRVQKVAEARFRQVNLLKEKRLIPDTAEPLEEDHQSAGAQLESADRSFIRLASLRHDQLGLRIQTASVHLLGEARELG